MTFQSCPSMERTTPFLMSAVDAMRGEFRFVFRAADVCRQSILRDARSELTNGVHIAVHTLTDHSYGGDIMEVRESSELFARVDIGDVDLGEREQHPGERVAEGYRGVSESSRVDHDALAILASRVNRIDQDAFVIALHAAHLEACFGSRFCSDPFDVCQRMSAVYLRFSGAEQVEVRAVDEQDAAWRLHDCTLPPAGRVISISTPIGAEKRRPVSTNPSRR